MKPIRLRGLLKGIFFASRLHHLVQPGADLLHLVVYLSKLSKWIDRHADVAFSDFYTPRFDYGKRFDLYRHVFETERLDGPIDFLEFGVASGTSFRWWVEHNTHPDSRFWGFDTFTGLPEDWGPYKQGDMTAHGTLPDVSDERAAFVEGLFQDTLHDFLAAHELTHRKVIHLDADIYSATLFTLTSLAPYLKSGDLLFFDEFNVPLHEFRAFTEFTEAFYVEYDVLGAVNNFYQVALRLR